MTTPPPPTDPPAAGSPSPPGQPGAPGYAPPGQPPPYPHPPPYHYPAYPPPRGTNTMAILALVLAFVFAPVGIVLGHMARKQIQQTGEEGDTLALVGMIVGYISTGLMLLLCLGYAAFLATMIGTIGVSSM